MASNDKLLWLKGYDWNVTINCSRAFPCGQTTLKQWYKKFIMPAVNVEADAVVRDLISYMEERMEDLTQDTLILQEVYIRENTRRKELIDHRASGKHANGVPMTKEEWKQAGADIREANQYCYTLLRNITRRMKKVKRLKANRDYLSGLVVMDE